MRNHADSGHEGIGPADGGGAPVFVDTSGRRARLLRRAGYGAAGLAAGYLAVLGLSLMGATPFAPEAVLPPLPGDSTPSAPQSQDAGGEPPPRDGTGIAAGPGSPPVPLLAGQGPSGAAPLAPGVPLVPGGPVPLVPAGPGPSTAQASPPPEQPSAPAPDDPSAPAAGDDPVPPPDEGTEDPTAPGTDAPPPEPPPGTPQPTPSAPGPEAPSGAPAASPPDNPPAAG
ncbi:hypothetical protein ABTY20_34540, partial [Streptomyces sp. NPDC126497]|uniref:hypothetical protein n=1 Tax=Streptomyces sp. NPDC126497 TaxID=3155313 RepID=UPI00331F2D81